MDKLIREIRRCTVCMPHLELGPNPVLAASPKSKIVIIGQAPGTVVHKSGVPWEDKSGDNLRNWLQVDKATFYDAEQIALIPMGFCYPGKGKSGEGGALYRERLPSSVPGTPLESTTEIEVSMNSALK